MIVGFTGTRNELTEWQKRKIFELLTKLRPRYAHHGMCVGGDDTFNTVCLSLGIMTIGWPSNIPKLVANCRVSYRNNPSPPLERNVWIVKASEVMICCPYENKEIIRSGTWSTIRESRRQHKKRYIFLGQHTP